MVPQDLEVYLTYPVDKIDKLVIFSDALCRAGELLFIQEYHIDRLPGAMREVLVRPVKNGVILALAYAYRLAADIAAFDDRSAQGMLIAA